MPGLLHRIIQRHSQLNQEERNTLYLSLEVIGAAALSSVQAFFAAYAIRLGATNTAMGLLNSLASLLTIFLALPAGRFLQKQRNQLGWTLGAMTAYRVGYLFLAVVPLIRFPGLNQGNLAVAVLVFLTAPLILYSIGVTPILMQAVPEERRAVVFSNRSVILLLVASLGVFLVGRYVSSTSFPGNYQVVLIIAVVLSQVSLFFWSKVRLPAKEQSTPEGTFPSTFKGQYLNLVRMLNYSTDLGRVIFNQIFGYIGIWMATPLYMLFYVRQLGASDSWIGLLSTIVNLSALGGWLLARRVVTRWGEPQTLKRVSPVVALFPILVGLSGQLTFILLAGALNSLVSPIYSLSHNNTMLKVIQPGEEHNAIAAYNTLANIGAFICPLIGVALATEFGYQPVLIGCGLLSLAGSLSSWIWPVRGIKPATA